MKILGFLFFAICICTFAIADTVNITWKNGDTTYDTTTCTVGGDLILPTPPTKTGYNFVGWEIKPTKELQYIGFASRSYAYIDTGIKLDSNEIELETKLKFNEFYKVAFGMDGTCSGAAGISNPFTIISGTNINKPQFRIGSYVREVTSTYGNVDTYSIYVDKSTHTVITKFNDEAVHAIWSGEITSDKNLFIGSNGRGNNCSFGGNVYYLKIKKDGVLVRDFVPAKDPDGLVCFFDRVTQTFFYNLGTPAFIAGPEVE